VGVQTLNEQLIATRTFRLTRLLLAIIVCILASASSLHAQGPVPGKNEFDAYAGASWDSPHVIGTTAHREIIDVGGRYGRTLEIWRNVTFGITIDVVPVELVVQPKITLTPAPGDPNQLIIHQGPRHAVYGGGFNPLGIEWTFFRHRRIQPMAASTAGMVFSVIPVPLDVPNATRSNFTFDFQGGVRIFNSSRTRAILLGYKYQHISNAYRTSVNPGVDGNVIFAGYSFFR
jgi:hypothetical protein